MKHHQTNNLKLENLDVVFKKLKKKHSARNVIPTYANLKNLPSSQNRSKTYRMYQNRSSPTPFFITCTAFLTSFQQQEPYFGHGPHKSCVGKRRNGIK